MELNDACVRVLIDARAPLYDDARSNRLPPLLAAADAGSEASALALLQAGADVNAQGQRERTALIAAVQRGHTAIAKALVDAQADVDLRDRDGRTALWFAALHSHVDIVSLLISARADVNIRDETKEKNSAVMMATNGSIVRMLLDASASVDTVDEHKRTPLMMAVLIHDEPLVRAYLEGILRQCSRGNEG